AIAYSPYRAPLLDSTSHNDVRKQTLFLLESTSHNDVRRQNSLLESTSHNDVRRQNSSPRIDFTQRRLQAKFSVPCRVGCISRPPAGHAQKRVFGRRCSGHIGAPATALPRVERFPNLKSTPSNGRTTTTTTIDENKSKHLLVKINVF
ncbi:hypothetical protein J6590_108055, partial [Homalodisca vitripennis]